MYKTNILPIIKWDDGFEKKKIINKYIKHSALNYDTIISVQ